MDLEKYRTLFVDEATEHVGEMGRAVARIGEGAFGEDLEEAVDTLFRLAHSIKGMAASMEYESISQLAHRLEDRMEPLRRGASFDERELRLVSATIDAFQTMIAAVDETGEGPEGDPDLLERLAEPREESPSENAGRRRLKKKVPRSLRHRCRVPSACARKRWTGFWPQWVS